MENIKWSIYVGLASVAIVFIVFSANFWIFYGELPGYKLIAYPGILVTRLFSEEIDFWPKLGIMLSGQFIICTSFAMTVKKAFCLCVEKYNH